jgi:hypothetical protein
VSKNAITINQLAVACRHFAEMRAAGVTENLAIRTLELFADVYAKLDVIGNASPHHVDQVKLWSVKARQLKNALPDAKPRDYFRVEHGTPRRGFAREVLALYRQHKLNEKTVKELVERHWKLAVITLDEDKHLNKTARTLMFNTPEERWRAAGIEFPPDIAATKKAVGGERKRYSDDMRITVKDEERAKKMHETSRRSQSFKSIKSGMTVGKYIENGGDRHDLNIMAKLGIVRLT